MTAIKSLWFMGFLPIEFIVYRIILPMYTIKMARENLTLYRLTIDFADLKGEVPTGLVARLYAQRTDTTNPQAPMYTAQALFNSSEAIEIRPDSGTGIATVMLAPSRAFFTPMHYVLRVGTDEVSFSMPAADANLLEILTGAKRPPPVEADANYYMAASEMSALSGAALVAALEAGSTSMARSLIAAPAFTTPHYLYYAQPSTVADPTSASPLPSRDNEIQFWIKQADTVTIQSTEYNVWRSRTPVFTSRSYSFS